MPHGRTGDPVVSRPRRALLDAGTRVSIQCDGPPFGGVVQPYEPEYSDGTFGGFDDGIWRTMTVDDVTVVAPSASHAHRGRRPVTGLSVPEHLPGDRSGSTISSQVPDVTRPGTWLGAS